MRTPPATRRRNSGVIPRNSASITEVEIHFKRIAVFDEQIERWNLPLRPNKRR